MANKAKSHSGAKKTFKISKNKKVIADKSCNNHLLTNKGKNNKKFKYGKQVSKAVSKKVKKLIPYN